MALVKYNNNSLSAITSTGLTAGAMTLIKEQTASSSATISFVNGTSDVVISSTYPIYLFKFINVHGATDAQGLTFNMSADTGSNYNVTKTTTFFQAYQYEDNSAQALAYHTGGDMAQATGFHYVTNDGTGADNDQSVSGELWLFNPSSTTFVKHFMIRSNQAHYANATLDANIAGYGNTTSAVDAIQFKMASGNIDAGTFKLYGIKDS